MPAFGSALVRGPPRPVDSHGADLLGAPCLGERVGLLATGLLGADQALIGEHLEGRIHRACARLPRAAAALLDLVDDLVAVHRLLPQEGEDSGTHVAASHARADADVLLEHRLQLVQPLPQAAAARPARSWSATVRPE